MLLDHRTNPESKSRDWADDSLIKWLEPKLPSELVYMIVGYVNT